MNRKKRATLIFCILFSLILVGFGAIFQLFNSAADTSADSQGDTKDNSLSSTISDITISTAGLKSDSDISLYYIYVSSKWSRIKSAGQTNYIANQFIAKNTTGSTINKYPSAALGTTKAATSLKTGPAESYCEVVQLPLGIQLELIGEAVNQSGEKWLMYKYSYAIYYVAANDVEITVPPTTPTQPASQTTKPKTTPTTPSSPVTPSPPATANAQKIVSLAYSKLGSAYVYGATGPNSFDCSGFVYWVVNNSGIPGLSVPRTSGALYLKFAAYNIGTSIANAHPGDIILFSTNGTVDGIAHSAIYYKDGTMIHASSPSTGVILTTVAYSTTNKSVFAIIRLPGV